MSFKPSVAQQRKCASCPETAVDGELVVMYDVNREEKAGELEVGDNSLEENHHAEAKQRVLVEHTPWLWGGSELPRWLQRRD